MKNWKTVEHEKRKSSRISWALQGFASFSLKIQRKSIRISLETKMFPPHL